MKARAGRIFMVEGEALHAYDVYTNDVYAGGGITNVRSWVGRSGMFHRLATYNNSVSLLQSDETIIRGFFPDGTARSRGIHIAIDRRVVRCARAAAHRF